MYIYSHDITGTKLSSRRGNDTHRPFISPSSFFLFPHAIYTSIKDRSLRGEMISGGGGGGGGFHPRLLISKNKTGGRPAASLRDPSRNNPTR